MKWAIIDAAGDIVSHGISSDGDEQFVTVPPGHQMVERPDSVNCTLPWRYIDEEWSLAE